MCWSIVVMNFRIRLKEKQMKKIESFTKLSTGMMAIVLAALVAGCGGSSSSSGVGSAGLGATGSVCSGASCVNLGTAANYVILAKTGASTVPNSVVTGNVGLSPAARTFLTGWSLVTEPTDTYFTSAQVTGKLYAADQVGGTTSSSLSTAVGDMGTAYTAAAGKAPAGGGLTTACPGTGSFGGLTIAPVNITCVAAA